MGWFRRGPQESEQDLWRAFVTIRSAASNQALGCGVMVSPSTVLTCAHVVNAAVGRDVWAQDDPTATVLVRFPNADEGPDGGSGPGTTVTARVSAWIPPRTRQGGVVTDGQISWRGDLALLELLNPPQRLPLPGWGALRAEQRLRARGRDGGPAGTVGLVVRSAEPHGSYVDPDGSPGPTVMPGYSGGPLWCPDEAAVVGLVCGQLQDRKGTAGGFAKRGFVLSSQQIHEEFTAAFGSAAAADLVGALRPRPETTAESESLHRMQLTGLVELAMPDDDRRRSLARRLCQSCALPAGPDGTAPGVEDFVTVLLEHPGAAATLTEALGADPHVDQLVDMVLRIPAPGLLSVGEREQLDKLLDRLHRSGLVTPADFDRAARKASPGARQDLNLSCSVGPRQQVPLRQRWLVRHLEGFTGARGSQPRSVPPLLRLVEHLAANAAERAADDTERALVEVLRAWSSRVARRLRLPDAALLEHRNTASEDAAERRRSGPSAGRATRFVVFVSRYQHGRLHGRYRLALWADLGEGGLTQLRDPADAPLTPAQAARLIRESVVSVRGGEKPVIEVFLDETELSLDIDEWDSAKPGSAAAQPLGAFAPVAVRTVMDLDETEALELRQSFDARWEHAHLGKLMHLDADCVTEIQARSRVWTNPHAAGAVVRTTDPGMRAVLAALCLRLGVPFVLWDRHAGDAVGENHFSELAPQEPVTGWAERIRCYRAEQMGRPTAPPLRPVLAMEDPRLPAPPRLLLLDPSDPPPSDAATATATATADEETTSD